MTTVSGIGPDSSLTSSTVLPSPNGITTQANHHYPDLNTAEQQSPQQPQPAKDDSSSIRQEETQSPPLSTVIASTNHRIHSFLAESHHPPFSLLAAVQHKTRTSLDIFASALSRYPLSELSLSYNGGKDCLVLLVLFLASLHPHPPPEEGGFVSIPAIYALPPDPFPAVEEFVQSSARAYHLSIVKYTTDPPRRTLKSSFQDYLALNPAIKAIFVGTRRTDPHGAKLSHFDRTDSGWPDFVRIHPVIDWHYAEIWAFIRHLGFEYCSLYEQGYTSLGGTSDTLPNPKLRVDDQIQQSEEESQREAQSQQYRPAYELTEDLEERLGRN